MDQVVIFVILDRNFCKYNKRAYNSITYNISIQGSQSDEN